MPLFNAINQGRFNSLLIRMFGMKISGAAAPSLAPEIAPSMDVNQQDDPSVFFLRGDRLAFGYASGGAPGAGNYRAIGLHNPVGSGVLAVLRRYTLNTSVAGDMIGVVTPQAPYVSATLTTSRQFRERRWGATVNQPACGPVIGVTLTPYSALAAGQTKLIRIPAGQVGYDVTFEQPEIVLPPGFQFTIGHETVATPVVAMNWEWMERPIPAEELATG